jgi:hypothetical protein
MDKKKYIYISKVKKLLKYLVLSLVVAVSMKYIPNNKIENKEIIMIASLTSVTFAILDIINPNIKLYN